MASEKNKNIQRAHLLLGLYWLYVLRREKSIPKATLEAARIQGNSLKREYRERRSAEKNGGTVKASAAGGVRAARPAVRSAGTSKKKKSLKIARHILKKARLF